MQSGHPARWEELLGASGRWAGLRDAAVSGDGSWNLESTVLIRRQEIGSL